MTLLSPPVALIKHDGGARDRALAPPLGRVAISCPACGYALSRPVVVQPGPAATGWSTCLRPGCGEAFDVWVETHDLPMQPLAERSARVWGEFAAERVCS